MTCRGICGNGAGIGTRHRLTLQTRPTQKGLLMVRDGFSAAELGVAMHFAAAPLTETILSRTTGAITLVFAWSGIEFALSAGRG